MPQPFVTRPAPARRLCGQLKVGTLLLLVSGLVSGLGCGQPARAGTRPGAAGAPPPDSGQMAPSAGRWRLPWIADSARPPGPLVRIHSRPWRAVVVLAPPVALIGYGLLTRERATGPFASRFEMQQDLQEEYPGFRTHLDDYTRHVPTAAVFGLSLAGVPARHGLPDRALLFAAANLLGTGVTSWLKRDVREARPYDSTNRSSFPSYHTAQAFIGATVLAEEYGGRPGGGWIVAGGYAVATATGVLRMLNNQHWSSDVLAGAGLGILSTELVYAVYPVLRRAVLGAHDRPLHALIVPTLPTRGSGVGVAAVWLLR